MLQSASDALPLTGPTGTPRSPPPSGAPLGDARQPAQADASRAAPVRAAPSDAPRVVVIGSGFGGLACAIRMLCKGYRVTVLERLDQPGGRASVFRQDGFTFDAGPTIVTAPFLLEELWALAGRRFADDVDLRPMNPCYRIRFHDGSHFDYQRDPQAMIEEVRRVSPDDVEGLRSFMLEADRCFRIGYEGLGTVAFESLSDLFAALPAMVRMRAWRSIYSMASRHFKSEKLRQVFSFHPLLIGGNPMTVTGVYSLIPSLERIHGVHSAMGGTGAIVAAMARLIRDLGGEIRLGADVERIRVVNRRARGVVLSGGERVDADIVVSNADSAWTYRHLLKGEPRRVWSDRKVDRAAYSMGLFVWYFGTRRRYPDVPHHMILLGPRYRDLLNDIFKRKILADDFSLYLHRPTATDPSLAPEGCDTFYVLSPVPHLEAGIDWASRAEPYRKLIQTMLGESVLPQLADAICTERLLTPADFESRYLAYRGAAFGMEPRLLQSAWFRPHNRSEDIDGLYLVGASTHPGAGIPGVLTSAKVLDSIILPANSVREARAEALR
ncbi:MAG: phytoene desaturase family protein [Betaproteobacteria bacterium]